MTFLLDTNILIHAHEEHASVVAKFAEHDGRLFASTLCLVELRRGLSKRQSAASLQKSRLDLLLSQIQILPFDIGAVDSYERIIAQCGFVRGRDFDRMIAAHALSVNAVLVTDNEADFSDIPGLGLENWAAP